MIRISGTRAWDVCCDIAGPLPMPREAALRRIVDVDGNEIDTGLVVLFEGPNSFTGEDVVELHVHGSIAVLRRLISELSGKEGLRHAEAGEFTRRALENGRLDLTQVEGLADLIDAETEAQRKQAFRVLSGELGVRVNRWRLDLVRAAALIEATIDFVDEDVPVDVSDDVRRLLNSVMNDLVEEIDGVSRAERIREGFEVAIVGPPNIGKSTLLNKIAGREAAITSSIAGTTRDVIEVRIDINGLPVTLLDTAGIRDAGDQIERLGIDLAKRRAEQADLRVYLTANLDDVALKLAANDIVLIGKGDESGLENSISGRTGLGIDRLLQRISDILQDRTVGAGIATHARHRTAMMEARGALATAIHMLGMDHPSYDVCAEEIRTALRRLEILLGHVDVEHLLDEIFSSFCIGK